MLLYRTAIKASRYKQSIRNRIRNSVLYLCTALHTKSAAVYILGKRRLCILLLEHKVKYVTIAEAQNYVMHTVDFIIKYSG